MLRRGRMLCRSRCAILIMLLTPCQRRNYQPKQERYPLVQPHFTFHSVIHYGLLDLKSCYASSPKFFFPNIAETALHSTAVNGRDCRLSTWLNYSPRAEGRSAG